MIESGEKAPHISGRAGAASPPPPKTTETLTDLLGISYYCKEKNVSRTQILTIVSPPLLEELQRVYLTAPLVAGFVSETIGVLNPSLIIVQSSLLDSGAWLGSIESVHVLSNDIEALKIWATQPGCVLIVLFDETAESVTSKVLRGIGNEFFPNRFFFDRLEGGPKRSEYFRIVHDYAMNIISKGTEADVHTS